MVGFSAIVVGGLSFALFEESKATVRDVARTEAQIRAFEIAESGITRAEMEVASGTDTDGDGLGTVRGVFGGGTFSVVAVRAGTEFRLVSTGRLERAQRVVEQGCRRLENPIYSNAIFATGTITYSGSAQTDSYDSRLGTYASQATHSDAFGTYAGTGGGIGSNGAISLANNRIRGDAIPGPTNTVSNGGNVTGTKTARSAAMALTPPPSTDFDAAWTTNDNGSWSGAFTYNSTTKAMTVSGGNTLTLNGGTYFFTKLTISGGSILKILGPTKIYCTQGFDTSGGSLDNTTALAANLEVIQYPYNYPAGNSVTAPVVKFSGGSNAYLTLNAQKSPLTVSGSSPVYGSLVVASATVSSSSFIHYDSALLAGTGPAPIEETYWIERNPPAR